MAQIDIEIIYSDILGNNCIKLFKSDIQINTIYVLLIHGYKIEYIRIIPKEWIKDYSTQLNLSSIGDKNNTWQLLLE